MQAGGIPYSSHRPYGKIEKGKLKVYKYVEKEEKINLHSMKFF